MTNRPLIGTTVSCVVTEKLRPGSVMARTAAYQGVVIQNDLPIGAAVEVILKKDRKYFFIGDLTHLNPCLGMAATKDE